MLWHHYARVNSHQRWKQMRFCVCFHLWCELTITMNETEWQVPRNSRKSFFRRKILDFEFFEPLLEVFTAPWNFPSYATGLYLELISWNALDSRNLQLFDDAIDLATPPPPTPESVLQKRARFITYFTVMNNRYGSKWLDTFLDVSTDFEINDPRSFGADYEGKWFHKIWGNQITKLTDFR